MVLGFVVVLAEPAVRVLNKQVEEITVGAISQRAMLLSLSIGVAVSVGISMLRVVTGISLWYFLIPGYAIAIELSFFAPKVFTAIAFDSGGVHPVPDGNIHAALCNGRHVLHSAEMCQPTRSDLLQCRINAADNEFRCSDAYTKSSLCVLNAARAQNRLMTV